MSFNTNNVRKHPKSTILAVLIFVAVMVPVFTGQAQFSEVSPVLIILIPLLLYGKDKGDPPNDFQGSIWNVWQMALLGLFLLSSCITRQKCLDKFGSISETVSKVDTFQIITPPDTLSGNISTKQFLEAFRAAKLDTLFRHQQGKAKVQMVYVPQVKEVQVKAECTPDTIDHYITRTITKELMPGPWDYAQFYARKMRSGLLWILIPVVLLILHFLFLKFLRL